MMGRRPAKDGDEQDAFFAPQYYKFNHSERAKIKTRARRRDRRGIRQGLRFAVPSD